MEFELRYFTEYKESFDHLKVSLRQLPNLQKLTLNLTYYIFGISDNNMKYLGDVLKNQYHLKYLKIDFNKNNLGGN